MIGPTPSILPHKTQRLQQTEFHATGEIRTRNPSKRAAADPRLMEHAATGICMYEACPENIQPFWISGEPVAWPWCNLADSQRRPYCAPVNSHSPVGLVSRQWDAVEWACVLCDRRIHNDWASRSANLHQCAWLFYSSRARFFGQNITSPRSVNTPTAPI